MSKRVQSFHPLMDENGAITKLGEVTWCHRGLLRISFPQGFWCPLISAHHPMLRWRPHPISLMTRKQIVAFPDRQRASATLRPKHLHHWYKSLAGGFRCACDLWRCEFTEGGKDCDLAAEQGRRYCLAHLGIHVAVIPSR